MLVHARASWRAIDSMTTTREHDSSVEANAFRERLGGTFQGIMTWEQLDALWDRIRGGRWFVFPTDDPPPERPLDGEPLAAQIAAIDASLRRDHRYDYCGIVYADDPEAPTLVKVYDPRTLGTSCSHGAAPAPPRWILSTARPASLERDEPAPVGRWRLWRPRTA